MRALKVALIIVAVIGGVVAIEFVREAAIMRAIVSNGDR